MEKVKTGRDYLEELAIRDLVYEQQKKMGLKLKKRQSEVMDDMKSVSYAEDVVNEYAEVLKRLFALERRFKEGKATYDELKAFDVYGSIDEVEI